MKKYYVSCHLVGEEFDLEELERKLNVELSHKLKKGDLSKLGNPSTYAAGHLQVKTQSHNLNDYIRDILDLIKKIESHNDKFGITEMNLWVSIYYVAQCNLEFEPAVLKELGYRNIPLLVDCYKVESGDIQDI